MENQRKLEQSQGAQIEQMLKGHNIPLEQWGKGKAKTVSHLIREVLDGETTLKQEGGELIRELTALGVDIYYRDGHGNVYKLAEDRQVFKDGRADPVRRRQLPTSLGEKIKPNESLPEAAQRAIKEELGIEGEIRVANQRTKENERISDSYPGLKSRYLIHELDADLDSSQYRAEGYSEDQPDKTTYFVWQRQNQDKEVPKHHIDIAVAAAELNAQYAGTGDQITAEQVQYRMEFSDRVWNMRRSGHFRVVDVDTWDLDGGDPLVMGDFESLEEAQESIERQIRENQEMYLGIYEKLLAEHPPGTEFHEKFKEEYEKIKAGRPFTSSVTYIYDPEGNMVKKFRI